MIEQASLVIGEGNWAVKSDSLLGYKINGGKYYPREMSVVRSTTGTRINEDGLVELVPYNLAQYSQDLSNAAYTKAQYGTGTISVTPNYGIAPDGTLTADRVQMTQGDFASELFQRPNTTASQTYTVSFWAKSLSGTPTLYTNFNLGYFNSVTFTSEWVRYEYTYTADATSTATGFNLITFTSLSGTSASADILVWGVQHVEGSSALDYLPTTDRLDVARIDYSSGSGALLVEPQRSNRLLYSEQFDISSYWGVNAGVTISSNVAISPSGILNADRYIESTPNNNAYQLAINSSGTFSASIYVKKASSSNIGFGAVSAGFSGGMSVKFNLDNQTFDTPINYGNFTSITSSYEALDNGWYRITLSGTTLTSDSYYFVIGSLQDTTYTANTYIWGAQFEVGSYQTSYIPTTSASVTRNIDLISKTGISSLIGQTEGTMFVQVGQFPKESSGRVLAISDGTLNNYIVIIKNSVNNNFGVYVMNGGVLQFIYLGVGSFPNDSKIAVAYANNNYAIYVNGTQVYSNATASVPTCSNIYIGQRENGSGTVSMGGSVKTAVLWKERLTNDQLATLTTI